jgi:hypothetical protein
VEVGEFEVAIGATIKLFAPEFNLRVVRVEAHPQRNQLFKQGEFQRIVLEILRGSGQCHFQLACRRPHSGP